MLYLAIIGNSLVVMIMGNFLLGLMAGFFWIPLDILVSVKSRKENRSEAFGRRSAAMGQGTLIGAMIGFGLLGFFNGVAPNAVWLIYSPLIVYGLGNFIAGIWFYWGVDEQLTIDEPVEENSRLSYWTYLKSLNRRFLTALLLIMTVLFLSSTNGSISKPFILVYLTENIESQPDLAAAAFIPSGITSMLLAPKLGKIADRLNIKIVISTGALAGALTTWLLINTSSLILFACLLVVDTTIATTTSLVIQNVVSRISLTNRGKIFGLQTLFVDFGAIIGPVIGGIFWDVYGQKSPFIFSIGIEILLIPVVILGISQIRPHLAEGLDH
jgi:MFS family permease